MFSITKPLKWRQRTVKFLIEQYENFDMDKYENSFFIFLGIETIIIRTEINGETCTKTCFYGNNNGIDEIEIIDTSFTWKQSQWIRWRWRRRWRWFWIRRVDLVTIIIIHREMKTIFQIRWWIKWRKWRWLWRCRRYRRRRRRRWWRWWWWRERRRRRRRKTSWSKEKRST